jgi:uracil-DNA glycosylase
MSGSWSAELAEEKKKPYFIELQNFIRHERQSGKSIYPADHEVFSALELTPLEKVKVVILGQDPYHGPGQAHGLAFSVKRGVPTPPSLVNIFKELKDDLGYEIPLHGNLESWAKQGVLLLNNVLTVEDGKPASHHGKGWEIFTDKVIEVLNSKKEHLVFILWGNPAQKKARIVDRLRHHVVVSAHPSPLSCYRGFLGSKPFSQTNTYLRSQGLDPIDWSLPH